tara:strand:- start:244 stop:405 length:162 start_codon:yes stop_codon:yes gene_type:complete
LKISSAVIISNSFAILPCSKIPKPDFDIIAETDFGGESCWSLGQDSFNFVKEV